MRVLRDALLAGLIPGLLFLLVMPLVSGGRLYLALAFLGATALGSLGYRLEPGAGLPARARMRLMAAGCLGCVVWLRVAILLTGAGSLRPEVWFRLWPFLLVPTWLGLLVLAGPRLSPLDILAWSAYAGVAGGLFWWTGEPPAAWQLTVLYLAALPVGALALRGLARTASPRV